MRLCLPVSQSDIDIQKYLVDALVFFGNLENHQITVFPSPSVAGQAAEICEPMRDLVMEGNYSVVPIGMEPTGGWPQACNQHFSAVMAHLIDSGNQEPFMWVESDCCPKHPFWADTILTQFRESKKPFLGHTRETREVMEGADGRHMVACGVYAHDFPQSTRMWQYTPANQPFDVWMRWEIAPRCHDSKLIQHCPRTRDWSKTKQGVDLGVNKDDGQNWIPFELSKESVFVHGCKDGSLSKLLCGQAQNTIQAPPQKMTEAERLEVYHKATYDLGGSNLISGDETKFILFTQTIKLPSPTAQDLVSARFKGIWDAISTWEIKVPGNTQDAVAATGAHAKAILDALPKEVELPKSVAENLEELLKQTPQFELTIKEAAEYMKVDQEYIREIAQERRGPMKLTGPGLFKVKLKKKPGTMSLRKPFSSPYSS